MDFLKIGKLFAQDYYAIPDYQRDYEWTAAQNSTLIDDVLQIAGDASSTNHFFGAIVTIPYEEGTGVTKSIDFTEYGIDEKQNVKHLVDGQQRLTSFSLLIKAVADLIMADESISDNFKRNVADRQLSNILLGNDYKGINPAPRLVLNGNTGGCYNKEILKISDTSYNKVYKGAKRILAAYSLFKTELQKGFERFKEEKICQSAEDYYQKVISAISNKVIFVEIECDASSDAFQVFDSLNGKGLDLTAADRIKNIFMSWSQQRKGAQKWEALVSDIGEDYLASFFVSLFYYHVKKRIAKNKLPDQFKTQYKESASNDFDFFFNDLKTSAVLYGNLRKAATSNDKVNNIISDFNALNMDQVYVLLFAVAKHYGEDILDNREYQDFVLALQTLIVRMQVCEKSTNKLDILFAKCIDALKEKSASLSVVTKILKEEIKASVDDNQFKAAFERFNPSDNKVAEFYLRHIENYMRKECGNRSPVEKGLTVEHIIPQTLYELSDWYGDADIPDEIVDEFRQTIVESIGNKALLYGDDNSSANNKNYKYKLDVYKNGKRGQDAGKPVDTFKLIEDVISSSPVQFTHIDVLNRAKRMAEYAVKIWNSD